MSRSLPEHPSLEFLRKEAKDRVRAGINPQLAAAQRALAQEYGFANWPQLKLHVASLSATPADALKVAIFAQDAAGVAALLDRHAELRAAINAPLPGEAFGAHALFCAVQRSDRATIEVLLAHGADIHQRTQWWAGGFGVLDDCDPSLAGFLLERGARLDAHAAARLGRTDELRRMLAAASGAVRPPTCSWPPRGAIATWPAASSTRIPPPSPRPPRGSGSPCPTRARAGRSISGSSARTAARTWSRATSAMRRCFSFCWRARRRS